MVSLSLGRANGARKWRKEQQQHEQTAPTTTESINQHKVPDNRPKNSAKGCRTRSEKNKPKVFWGNPVALMLFLVYSQASAAESANSSKTPNESLFYNKIKLKCI